MISNSEMHSLLSISASLYNRPQPEPVLVASWNEVLKNQEYPDVATAFDVHIKSSSFFPTPANILEIIETAKQSQIQIKLAESKEEKNQMLLDSLDFKNNPPAYKSKISELATRVIFAHFTKPENFIKIPEIRAKYGDFQKYWDEQLVKKIGQINDRLAAGETFEQIEAAIAPAKLKNLVNNVILANQQKFKSNQGAI